MLELIRRNWGWFMLRGLAGIAFGAVALFWPAMTMTVLVALFGAYALADGAFSLVAALRRRHAGRVWPLLFEGIAGLVAGVVTWCWPGITAFALLALIALWSIVTGLFELDTAIRLRREIEGEWLLGLAGVASIGFGVVLMFHPGAGALALVWLIGAYAFFFGALLITFALWLRTTHTVPFPGDL
jgi:uncharacterized membrane protein HdeD (DUF308 family)